MHKTADLTRSPLWKESCALAEHLYDKLEAFDPDEKWNTERKLRNAANDMIFYVAQGAGGLMPETADYDWSSAHKHLFALRTMYVFAGKQKFLELEPEIVVRMDTLLAQIEAEFSAAQKQTEAKSQKELKPWLEKYRLWKEMQQ